MPYDRLVGRLDGSESPTLSTLPDGSVDKYCSLSAGMVGPLGTRAAFGREIRDGERSSFRFAVEATEPGGQAVNAAAQLHALGSDVTCYGHLDAPAFDGVGFETASMGEPALVYAFNFADGDVMFAENAAFDGWTLADLRRVADLEGVFGVDAVCCGNWVSFPGLSAAFHRLGEADLPRTPFVFDPGDVVGANPDELADLREALAALQEAFDVVYSANRQEIGATAATLAAPPSDDAARLEAIRAATGVEAVVMHAPEEAAVASRDGVARVENLGAVRPARHTGGGDRFSGGLAYGLALGWDWEPALALGNVCAVHYVETGETGGAADLRGLVESKAGG